MLKMLCTHHFLSSHGAYLYLDPTWQRFVLEIKMLPGLQALIKRSRFASVLCMFILQ